MAFSSRLIVRVGICVTYVSNMNFIYSCPISRMLVSLFLSSVRVQMNKIETSCMCFSMQMKYLYVSDLSKTLFILGIWPVSSLVIVKKQIDVSLFCICPLIEDKFCHMSKFAAEPCNFFYKLIMISTKCFPIALYWNVYI